MKFMTTGTEQINIHFFHINGNVGIGLHGISVKENIVLFCNRPDVLDGFDGADFIVRKHDTD